MKAGSGGATRWRVAAAIALLAAALLPAPASAEARGVVFVDRDGDGVRGPGEPGQPGVRVSNGREVAITDADGAYRLPPPARGFVVLTLPDGFRSERWYRREAGDFPLTPVAAESDFFFVQISDTHVFREASEFTRYSLPPIPSWLPGWLRGELILWRLDTLYPDRTRSQVARALRDGLQPYSDTQGQGDGAVADAFLAEFARPDSELGRVADLAQRAFAEVAALRPSFVLSTGDLVLEGNTAPPRVVLDWLSFYRELAVGTGVPFHHTLGNNELAAFQRGDADPADPAYGRGAYEILLGPATYSFDRGAFHFAVTDTHLPVARNPEPPWWNFDEMEPGVRDWLDADLAAHAGRTLVVLNHEPFFSEPLWEPYEPARDAGLFAKHAVRYTITGHVHRNGLARIGPTTHIVTGALSGGRWMLPAELHPRGYRLFYARGDRLFSAWKALGEPALGFVDPPGDLALAPASREPRDAQAISAPAEIIAVAADASGPFAAIELEQDGEPVPFEPWGDYFLRARVAPRDGRATAELVLRGRSADGEIRSAHLELRFAPGESSPRESGTSAQSRAAPSQPLCLHRMARSRRGCPAAFHTFLLEDWTADHAANSTNRPASPPAPTRGICGVPRCSTASLAPRNRLRPPQSIPAGGRSI